MEYAEKGDLEKYL